MFKAMVSTGWRTTLSTTGPMFKAMLPKSFEYEMVNNVKYNEGHVQGHGEHKMESNVG
jgi:hypothetical protein